MRANGRRHRAPIRFSCPAARARPGRGASSPQAWRDDGQQVLKACRAASTLRSPRPSGERVDGNGHRGGLVSVLLLEGTERQPPMAGRRNLELRL